MARSAIIVMDVAEVGAVAAAAGNIYSTVADHGIVMRSCGKNQDIVAARRCVVGRGRRRRMQANQVVAMTGDAFVGRWIAGCKFYQTTFCIMTACTEVVNLGVGRIDHRRRTGMAAVTADRDLNCQTVIDVFRVHNDKGTGMTGSAVAASGEFLINRQASEATLGIMTGVAGVMHLGIGRIDQRRSIAVTVAATCGFDLDQSGMIDVIRMHSVKGVGMAGGAVAWTVKRSTRCLVDQPTLRIVTGGAGVMHLGIDRIDQWRGITVTVAATRSLDLD